MQQTESRDANDMISNKASNQTEVTSKETPNEIKESEFTRKTIENLGSKVRLTDSDENLELFCYTKCNQTDDPELQNCRGVVFHKENLVMQAFPYTIEYSHTDRKNIQNLEKDLPNCLFFDSHEGALIRVFHFGDRWYTSTHRKLNAFRSKWASRESFGTLFKKALEEQENSNENFKNFVKKGDDNILTRFQNSLDKTKQYMFLIKNSDENRIVCSSPEKPTVFHVGTFVDGKLSFDEDIKIPYPNRFTFSTIDQLIDHVNNIDVRELQGVICFAPNNKQYKILHDEYMHLFKVRGNEPSIKFRYLQVRMKTDTLDTLYYLYPHMSEKFDEIENSIYEIAKNIYTAYVQRFIKKRFVTMPTEEFIVMKQCHKWHEEDRVKNRINMDKVISVLNEQSPTSINKMIRRFRNEKNEQKQTKIVYKQRARSTTTSSANSPSIKGKISLPFTSPLLLSKSDKIEQIPTQNL